MKPYLKRIGAKGSSNLADVYDELPLWAAPFGLRLLEAVEMKTGLRVLDVGCGTGFPLLELAQRLDSRSILWGIDPWSEALERILLKLRVLNVHNVRVVRGDAAHMPFSDNAFDLIVANNGINNVDDPEGALRECGRVAVPGAQLVMTMNLGGTMVEFYRIFEKVLKSVGDTTATERINAHIQQKRMPLERVREMLTRAAYRIESVHEDSFFMSFADGEALFRHHFIRCNFLKPWMDLVSREQREDVFSRLEERLGLVAGKSGGLKLTVPFVCLNCKRQRD